MKKRNIPLWMVLTAIVGCGSDRDGVQEPETPPNLVNREEPVEPPPVAANVEVINCPETSGHSDYEDGFNLLINDSHEFRERYLSSRPDEQEEPPEIDFDSKSVIAVHAGFRSTGSQRVVINKVDLSQEEILVEYLIVRRCDSDTENVTYPFCFVAIDKHDGPISFTEADEFCTDQTVNP